MLIVLLQQMVFQAWVAFRENTMKTGVSPVFNKIIWMIACLIFVIILVLITWNIDYSKVWYLFVIYTIISGIEWVAYAILWQLALREEKSSDLNAYWQSLPLIIIIFSFIVFPNQSLTAFSIAIIAWLVLFLSAVDFKKWLKLSKWTAYVMIANLISATEAVILWLIIKNVTSETLVLTKTIIITVLVMVMYNYAKSLKIDLAKTNTKFYVYRTFAWVLWTIALIIWMYLVESIWLLKTTLIWFIWIFTRIIIWRIVFKELPTKKHFFLAIFLAFMAFLWNYLS